MKHLVQIFLIGFLCVAKSKSSCGKIQFWRKCIPIRKYPPQATPVTMAFTDRRREGVDFLTLSQATERELSFSLPFVLAVKFPAASQVQNPYAYTFIAWASN